MIYDATKNFVRRLFYPNLSRVYAAAQEGVFEQQGREENYETRRQPREVILGREMESSPVTGKETVEEIIDGLGIELFGKEKYYEKRAELNGF